MKPVNSNRGDGQSVNSIGDKNLHERTRAACPVCQGKLVEIRGKLQCLRCHTICETCCEGGRG